MGLIATVFSKNSVEIVKHSAKINPNLQLLYSSYSDTLFPVLFVVVVVFYQLLIY